ncbi:hypothetical protein HK100_011004 [Physocladia obscura]|uniref:ATP-dependent RNA helicase n=1 Tax=Physocladia obscura TaxID=109957 RepID=A0AAD5T1T7_9FUNG|nr:hypothetical protein HK100_011004 [Physocladia obscura]
MLRLSTGEVEKLKQDADKERRIRRLQEVRDRAKDIARKKRDEYQHNANTEWSLAIQTAKQEWEESKDIAVERIIEIVDSKMHLFGLAHAQADCLREEAEDETNKLRKILEKTQQIEFLRGNQALNEMRNKAKQHEADSAKHIQTLAEIRKAETLRAKYLAEHYRQIQETYAKDMTPISQPLHRIIIEREFRSRKPGRIMYDSTQHHQNFAVIRLEPDAKIVGKDSNAAERAPLAALAAVQRLKQKEERDKLAKVKAEARYHTAVTAKTMDTKKDDLCKELEILRLEDRQRKYRNAGGGPPGLASRRTGFIDLDSAGKKEEFTRRFGIELILSFYIGDEPAFSLENTKKREFLRREYGIDRIENESMSDSIEFSHLQTLLPLFVQQAKIATRRLSTTANITLADHETVSDATVRNRINAMSQFNSVGAGTSSGTTGITFESIGASARVALNLRNRFGIETATSMQSALLPAILSHRDVVLKNETGTGKSLGILVALLSKKAPTVFAQNENTKNSLAESADPKKLRYLANIIVAPTPELATQFYSWALELLHGIAPADMHKHVQLLLPFKNTFESANALLASQTPTLLIGTPRRLFDVIVTDKIADISRLQTLALDEADALARIASRFSQNKEKFNKLVHPLHSEMFVAHILQHRRPESVGGILGKNDDTNKKTPFHKSLVQSINSAQSSHLSILSARARVTPSKLISSNPSAIIDAATARRLQVLLCSATMNNPVRRELERARGWIVDPILLDIKGTHSAPVTIAHTCLVMERQGDSVRNMLSKNAQDHLHEQEQEKRVAVAANATKAAELNVENANAKLALAKTSEEKSIAEVAVAAAIKAAEKAADKQTVPIVLDPVWIEKMKHPALEDDDLRILALVSKLFRADKATRAILFLNGNISCLRVVEKLKIMGINAARINEDVDYQASLSRIAPTIDLSDANINPDGQLASGTPAYQSKSFFDSVQTGGKKLEMMVISEHNGRGLDLPDVSHVFMVGPPSSPASFLHMSGRVGRFGKPGKSILILGGERYERKMVEVYNLLGITPVEWSGIEKL